MSRLRIDLTTPCATWPRLFDDGNRDEQERALAVDLCGSCPQQQPCLAQAVADPTLSGVYGGRLFKQREKISAAPWLPNLGRGDEAA